MVVTEQVCWKDFGGDCPAILGDSSVGLTLGRMSTGLAGPEGGRDWLNEEFGGRGVGNITKGLHAGEENCGVRRPS